MVWLGRPELEVLPDINLIFLTVPLLFYSGFEFLSRVGTHLDFEFHLSFQKLRASLSPLLKSALICSQSFSKAIVRKPISRLKGTVA